VGAEHARIADTLGAWALDACEHEEARAVEAHLGDCPACANEAARLRDVANWLGASDDEEYEPPPTLRGTVLAAAWAIRPPTVPPSDGVPALAPIGLAAMPDGSAVTAAAAYQAAVATLDAVVRELTAADWERPAVDTWSVRDLLVHLTAADGLLAEQVGLPVEVGRTGGDTVAGRSHAAVAAARAAAEAPELAWARWRTQAQALAAAAGPDQPDHRGLIYLADRRLPRRPLVDGLTQRLFETWVHTDDIRLAADRRVPPPPVRDVAAIARLGVAVLPAALALSGARHGGQTARLVLDGAAGGDWLVPFDWQLGDPDPVDGAAGPAPAATVTLEAVEFCYLMAGRRSPDTLDHVVTGDTELAAELLRVTATLGCDY
jgi:uncharacterized protein (TIGR03083 family)